MSFSTYRENKILSTISAFTVHVSKGAKIRNRYTDPGYQCESDKLTIRHQKREPRGQPFPSR